MAAQLIALGVVPRGSRVLDFDPKADHGWENIAPLGDRLKCSRSAVATTRPARSIRSLSRPTSCARISRSPICWSCCPIRRPRGSTPLRARSVTSRQRGDPSTRAVLDHLRQLDSTAGSEAADALDVLAEVGLGRLGFGRDHDHAVALSIPGVTTMRVAGLMLPEEGIDRASYSRTRAHLGRHIMRSSRPRRASARIARQEHAQGGDR